MKEIQLSHKDHTHITTISEHDLKQLLQFAENWSTINFPIPENQDVENTIKFLRMSLDL